MFLPALPTFFLLLGVCSVFSVQYFYTRLFPKQWEKVQTLLTIWEQLLSRIQQGKTLIAVAAVWWHHPAPHECVWLLESIQPFGCLSRIWSTCGHSCSLQPRRIAQATGKLIQPIHRFPSVYMTLKENIIFNMLQSVSCTTIKLIRVNESYHCRKLK